MGSKARHGSELLNVIKQNCDFESYTTWIEPFVGGANMIDKVNGIPRIGNDINEFVIAMFRAIQNGWSPPSHVSEDTYKEMRECSKTSQDSETIKATIGFVGIGCSYSGKWFGGYARGNDSKGNPRNYCKESRDNLLRQDLSDIRFVSMDYQKLPIPPRSIIYCDPPYSGTTKYKDNFNHKEFWDWCVEQEWNGHKVFVSEYSAPEEWECIWSKAVNNSLTKETGSRQGIEKLFIYNWR